MTTDRTVTRTAAFRTHRRVLHWGLVLLVALVLLHGSSSASAMQPAAANWRALPLERAPVPRYGHAAVWTGTEMIVWGGLAVRERSGLNDGARYAPLWLVPSSPVQVYSITDDPLWIAQPGERYRVVSRQGGWALVIWEGDGPRWSVWIQVDMKVNLRPL